MKFTLFSLLLMVLLVSVGTIICFRMGELWGGVGYAVGALFGLSVALGLLKLLLWVSWKIKNRKRGE